MPRPKNPETSAPAKRTPRKPAAAATAGAATEPVYSKFVDPTQRAALIARAAYLRAQNRGFMPGHEVADWLAAEAEVDADLLRGTPPS
jgi:Protein of unknown function (DUF2934)